MWGLLGFIAILFLILAISIALVELQSGFLGPCSMMPGFLLLGIVWMTILVAIGFLRGDFILQVQ